MFDRAKQCVAGLALACLALGGTARAAEKLPWAKDLDRGLEAARKANKRVFIDFTGPG